MPWKERKVQVERCQAASGKGSGEKEDVLQNELWAAKGKRLALRQKSPGKKNRRLREKTVVSPTSPNG